MLDFFTRVIFLPGCLIFLVSIFPKMIKDTISAISFESNPVAKTNKIIDKKKKKHPDPTFKKLKYTNNFS